MSLFGRLLARPQAAITSSYELDRYLRTAGQSTASGAVVSPETALTVSAVFACVRVLSEQVAQIPLHLFRRTPAGRERVTDHWVARLLQTPNPWQTGYEWRETMQAHLALCGNAYAIRTVVRGETRELLPIAPHRVTVEQDAEYRVSYTVTLTNGTRLLVPVDRMLHLAGLSWNGVAGISVVGAMREVIGVGLQQIQYGARLYGNGAQIRGVLKHPGRITKDASDRLRAQFDETYSGIDNAHKTLLLEEGADFVKTGMTAEDAQFLESRRFTQSEIASWFRVPPHLIGDLSRSTNNNIEQQALEFVMYTLLPWLTRWEARLTESLIPAADRATLYPKFIVQGLLRGDFKTRTEGYRLAVLDGWMSRNEVRALEDLNTVEGLDDFLTPLNVRVGNEPVAKGDGTP